MKGRSFLQIANESIAALNTVAQNPSFKHDEHLFGKYLDNLRLDPAKMDQTIVSRGVYAYDLAHFLSSYHRDDILFITGKELIVTPAQVMIKIQKFVPLPMLLGSSNFVYNSRTGFYCLSVNHRLNCLSDEKSRTTGQGKPTPDPVSVKKLQHFYEPYNKKLAEIVGYEFQWK